MTDSTTQDLRLKYSPCICFNAAGHDPGSAASGTHLRTCDDFPSDSSSSDSSSSNNGSDSSSSSSSHHLRKCKSQTKKHKSKSQVLCDKQAHHQKKVTKVTDFFLFKCAKNWNIDELQYSNDIKSHSQMIC